MNDVELLIMLDVIFSNTTKDNITEEYKRIMTIINERYENRINELM